MIINNKTIMVTSKGHAELVDTEIKEFSDFDVLVETEYTAISAGTERDNLLGTSNLGLEKENPHFPRYIGYSGVGIVKQIGSKVTKVAIGDRVIVRWGTHSKYNRKHEDALIKIDSKLDPKFAAFVLIATFSTGGLRKTRLEFGESAMVVGVGLLGAFAIAFAKLAGAYPVIASDLDPKRRELAKTLGADFVFDPKNSDYMNQVKSVTKNKQGAQVIIEVTGNAFAMSQSLDCAAPFGRVSLLGCTRVSNAPVDFYQQVHRPGVEIIGAHTDARPKLESRPYYWTEIDDCNVVMNYILSGRLDMNKIVTTVYNPLDATEVFNLLAEGTNFPVGAVFDWNSLKTK